ncbi:MAG: tetratricopeptide repeat protein [Lysobacterales bacterium]|nr:MAG: tetratricopeptide repeat protein [Xanthomonadales bacterium]
MRIATKSATIHATVAALAVCGVWVLAIDAQEPAVTAPAADGALGAAPLTSLRRTRDAFIDVRDFSAALTAAQAIVDAQREQREPEYPADLAALGLIQGELRATDDALAHLAEAIEIVESAEGANSPTLIDYYRGLGRTYIRGGYYQEAILSLEQAQHISQRNLGLFNVEQAPLLDDITTAYLGLGNTIDARKAQVERLDNAIRRFGPGDPRVIPYRYTLAKYYQQSRLPDSAREQYQEVLNAEETRLGASDPGLLAPLRELVALDLLVSQGVDPARRDRLAALLAENRDAHPIERGLSLALLGDWATVTGDAAAARDYYADAWSTLQTTPEFDVAAYFAKPAMLDFVPPLGPVDRNERSRPYTWAEIALQFDVSAEGKPGSVRVVTRDPQMTALQSRYSRRMRETHFRPRMVDGAPVATTNVRSTHYVRRYVDKDEEQAAE